MKFRILTDDPEVIIGTTYADQTFYYYRDTGLIRELKYGRNRMGQMTHDYRDITNPAHVKEIKEAMLNYEIN